MEKTKLYKDTYFSADVVKRAIDENLRGQIIRTSFRLRRDNETWEFDDEREFFAKAVVRVHPKNRDLKTRGF